MEGLLCQICTRPADRDERGWLFLHGPVVSENTFPAENITPVEGVLTAQPPVCLPHALTSATQCPHLDGRPLAMRVRLPLLYGVIGALCAGDAFGRPVRMPDDGRPVAYGDMRMPWILASQSVVRLVGVTVVDLEQEAETALPRRTPP
ncbi:hypothetical protein AB0O07_19200 [Streptomyces sp. NPDC093085]|uniref:hypothetical protein n=1 Tax=Streptomyces sp. NPDC093085 TaxID=3155068 RepID=UPI003412486E